MVLLLASMASPATCNTSAWASTTAPNTAPSTFFGMPKPGSGLFVVDARAFT